MEVRMFGWLIWIAIAALDIWAVLNVFRNAKSDGEKIAWLIGILIFPIVGFIAWYVAGPKDTKLLPPR
jgi:hypothetical protein